MANDIKDIEAQRAALEALTGATNLSVEQVRILTTDLANQASRTLATLSQHKEAMDGIASSTARAVQEQERAIEVAQAQLNLAVSLQQMTDEQVRAEQQRIRVLQESLQDLKENTRAASALGKSLSGAFKLSGVGNFSEKLTGVRDALRGGAQGAGEFASSLMQGIDRAVIDNIAGLVIKLIDTESAFRKSTGASKEYARSVTRTYEATRQYGVSAEEASSATMALYRSFTDFTLSSARVQASLRETAGIMAELGVSNESFAQTTQMATKMLGVSAGQMQNTTREIATYAQEMNMDMGQMFQQLGQAGPQLAKYGNQGIDTFKRLQHVFKITGLEMNKVLQMTSKFDTFEGAARQAGMLNAALGSNMVNAMELMQETDPVGRFQMLRNAILDTGLTFDKMSYYQKIFYKDALGLSDVGDLAMMLSGDMRNLAGVTQRTAKDWKEFKAQAASVQGLMDLFKATIASMVPVLTPVMSMVKAFFEYLNSDAGAAMRKTIQALIALRLATKAFGIVIPGIGKLVAALAGKLGILTAGAGPAAGAMQILAGGLKKAGQMLTHPKVALGILVFAGSLDLVSRAAARTANSMANLVSSVAQISAVAPSALSYLNAIGKMKTSEFEKVAAGLGKINAELDKIPEEKTIKLTQAMHSVINATEAAKEGALVNLVGRVATTGGGGGGGGGGDYHHVPIDLSIGGTRFERYVLKIVGNKISQVHRKQAKK